MGAVVPPKSTSLRSNSSRHAQEYVYIGVLSFITGLVASAETSVIAPFLVRNLETQ